MVKHSATENNRLIKKRLIYYHEYQQGKEVQEKETGGDQPKAHICSKGCKLQ